MKSICIVGKTKLLHSNCVLAPASPEAGRGCGLSSSAQHHPLSPSFRAALGTPDLWVWDGFPFFQGLSSN